jgi:ATP-dependent helicase/nuclease subunit B
MPRNVFTIAPGAPYLATFVRALLAGRIIPGFSRASAPLDLARLSIYVPTQRAGRALSVEFARALDRPAALLPRILPLGALDEHENAMLFSGDLEAFEDSLAPAIDELDRRLILARLVMQWGRALGHAVISIGPDGEPALDRREPMLVSPSPANACALAKDLGALIDEFIIENVDPAGIGSLADEAFDRYWAITTRFLGIALQDWPQILRELNLTDAARRQKALLEAQIESLKAASSGDGVIALGSTGSNPTTARLLDMISRQERGAVVLPGLDCVIDETAWTHIGDAVGEHGEPAFTHPQSMMKRLLRIMKIDREEVGELAVLPPALAARRDIVAQALRPADSTEHWRGFRERAGAGFSQALQGVDMVEAPDERLEALTIALYMRRTLETPHRTAALITPDRGTARRVAAELARFGLEIDDSGGEPLSATPIGDLARLLCALARDGAGAVETAALLAHPLASFGFSRDEIARLAPLAEVAVLRVVAGEGRGWGPHVALAQKAAREINAHPAAARVSADDWRGIGELFARLDLALAPLLDLAREEKLATRAAALRASLEAATATEAQGFCADMGLEELLALLDKLEDAGAPLDFDAAGFAAFFDALLFETIVRGPRRAHPRLKIMGPLEARLIDADLVLLAGLDESVWPPQADTGAFLNRSMRQQLGLSPPERRIGQSAHDFTMALGADEVVMTRARKRAGSPTVASRFVTRLSALAGEAFEQCRRRGDAMSAIANALDQPASIASCKPPEPRPPLELRPSRLSVTRIETLRRDPYSIYAERILKLASMPKLGAELGPRERGTAVHDVLEKFVRAHPHGRLPDDAREKLHALAREKLSAFFDDPEFCAFKWPRVLEGLDHALAFDHARRELGVRIFLEESGGLDLTLGDGSKFLLTACADRIEIDPSGAAFVFDYKTGTPPTNRQVLVGFQPQLTLEAAMVAAGAFKEIGAQKVEGAAYVAIGGGGEGEAQWIKPKDESFADLVAEHKSQLVLLLSQFRDPGCCYPSRPNIMLQRHEGDYDHLARVKEWSRSGGAVEGTSE